MINMGGPANYRWCAPGLLVLDCTRKQVEDNLENKPVTVFLQGLHFSVYLQVPALAWNDDGLYITCKANKPFALKSWIGEKGRAQRCMEEKIKMRFCGLGRDHPNKSGRAI